MRIPRPLWIAAAVLGLQEKTVIGYDDTPFLPGGKWRVHDSKRPPAPVVTPGASASDAPSDALVLFDGKDLSKWSSGDGKDARWKVAEGYVEVVAGAGDIQTREEFGDCQLHLEFATPADVKKDSQGRGNSGVFFMGRYELQVLDSFENRTYADGQCAALYGQHPPLANACRRPGEWQSYDVVFTAPRFDGEKLASPARMTVIHNGVLVHDHAELYGATAHRALAAYAAHGPAGPLRLQDHGDPLRFRNIWIRRLKASE
jgi:Domain of Unknown Function (DUF1080)